MTFSRKILITTVAITGFYVVASVVSRSFMFEYSSLIWTSFLIYLAAGYLGGRRRGLKCGMLLGSLAGFIDSTIGWFISRLIGPLTEISIQTPNLAVMAPVTVTTTAIGFVFGMIGAGLWEAFGRPRPFAAE